MQTHASTTEKQAIGAGRTALLVDDDPDFVLTIGTVLRAMGFEVRDAGSVAEGSERFREKRPDLAIVDLMLDEPDGGFILCHLIKKESPQVPVIVCSAVKSETGLEFGPSSAAERQWIKADAWLPKPVRVDELTREIERVLEVT
jgi:CheY-like chemotaxis protein